MHHSTCSLKPSLWLSYFSSLLVLFLPLDCPLLIFFTNVFYLSLQCDCVPWTFLSQNMVKTSCPGLPECAASGPEHLVQVPCVRAVSWKAPWDIWNSSPKLTSLSSFLNLLCHPCGVIFHPALGHRPPPRFSFIFIIHQVLLPPSVNCLK